VECGKLIVWLDAMARRERESTDLDVAPRAMLVLHVRGFPLC